MWDSISEYFFLVREKEKQNNEREISNFHLFPQWNHLFSPLLVSQDGFDKRYVGGTNEQTRKSKSKWSVYDVM